MPNLPINLPGIGANFPNPGTFVWRNFAAGPASGSGAQRKAILIGNLLSSGVTGAASVIYGPDTAVPASTEQDWINLFGYGSELHRGFKRFTKANKTTPLYAIGVAQSGGTAASTTVTVATVPSANGVARVYINDEFVEYSFSSGDTLLSIVNGIRDAINARQDWGVTATAAVATVTITAKQAGPRGNWLQVQASIRASSGGAMNTTITQTTKAFFTSGATADSNTAALAVLATQNFYYQISAAEDATQFGALVTQVEANALPTIGICDRAFCGGIDSQSNTNTIATGLNAERAGLIWGGADCDIPPFELACAVMGAVSYLEASTPPRHNFSLFPFTPTDAALWTVPAARSRKQLMAAQITSAITNGVSAVNATPNGQAQLVKLCTTRSLTNSISDSRIRDHHRVTEIDYFGDDLAAKLTLQFGGKDIVDDPAQGAPPPPPTATTPNRILDATLVLVDDYVTRGSFKNGDQIKAGTVAQHETNPTNRASVRVPAQVIDILEQIACEVDQVAGFLLVAGAGALAALLAASHLIA